jgi:hypothetical protein
MINQDAIKKAIAKVFADMTAELARDEAQKHNAMQPLVNACDDILYRIFTSESLSGADTARVTSSCTALRRLSFLPPVQRKIASARNAATYAITASETLLYLWRRFDCTLIATALTEDLREGKENAYTLLRLPRPFARISQVVVNNHRVAVLGTDEHRRPLLASTNLLPQPAELTEIRLPDHILAVKHILLKENNIRLWGRLENNDFITELGALSDLYYTTDLINPVDVPAENATYPHTFGFVTAQDQLQLTVINEHGLQLIAQPLPQKFLSQTTMVREVTSLTEPPSLSRDVLTLIFNCGILTATDVARASRTCKAWLLAARTPAILEQINAAKADFLAVQVPNLSVAHAAISHLCSEMRHTDRNDELKFTKITALNALIEALEHVHPNARPRFFQIMNTTHPAFDNRTRHAAMQGRHSRTAKIIQQANHVSRNPATLLHPPLPLTLLPAMPVLRLADLAKIHDFFSLLYNSQSPDWPTIHALKTLLKAFSPDKKERLGEFFEGFKARHANAFNGKHGEALSNLFESLRREYDPTPKQSASNLSFSC